MPPYGLYSLANTPEELLNRGYGYSTDIPYNQLSDAEENLMYTEYDPAFGNLNTDFGYFSAPYTGAQPFQNASFLRGERNYDLGFSGDIDIPSFGGASNINYNQFEPEGILSQVDSRFPLYDDFTVAEEGDDLEENAVTVDELGNLKQPSGFKDFLKMMLGFAIPGAGLFMGDRSALEGIKSLNQRLRNTDFGQSRTGAEYFMKRRERKQAERAQQAMPDVYRDARDQGFTNDRGGFSTNRADRAGTSVGSGQFSPKTSRGRSGY